MTIRLLLLSAVVASPAFSQEPEGATCRGNPLIWERKAGDLQSPNETSVIASEGMRTLGIVSVAEMIKALPNGGAGPMCTEAIEKTLGGDRWLVSECGDLDGEMAILGLEPGSRNPNTLRFTVTLLNGKCRVDTNVSLDEPGQSTYEYLQDSTLAELDALVAEVRAETRDKPR